MNTIDTGGPAYPGPCTKPLENYYPGITVRDFFAAAALQGLLAHCAGEYQDSEHAIAAYGLADAMLKARSA